MKRWPATTWAAAPVGVAVGSEDASVGVAVADAKSAGPGGVVGDSTPGGQCQ